MRWLGLLAVTLVGCGSLRPTVYQEPPPCEVYCALTVTKCVSGNLQYRPEGNLSTMDVCLSTCEGFDGGGQPGDSRGNTLQCRMTFAMAAHVEPYAFCRNAGPTGDPACQ